MGRRISADESESFFDAIRAGDVGTIQEMLERGFPVDATREGTTGLYKAADKGDVAMMRTLIQAGANVNFRAAGNSSEGHFRTALNLACKNGQQEAISLLFDHGADPRIVSMSGATPIHYLAGSLTRLAAIVPPIKLDDEFICTTVTRALDAGVMANQTDERGNTMLHAFAWTSKGPTSVIRLLLARGADPSSKNYQGVTPLHIAASGSMREGVFSALLEDGTTLEARAFDGCTPLHSCSDANIDALLAHHPNLEAQDVHGQTPLMKQLLSHMQYGAPGFVPPTVARLLEAGASLDTADFGGVTPRHLLKSPKLAAIAALVAAAQARGAMRRTAVSGNRVGPN